MPLPRNHIDMGKDNAMHITNAVAIVTPPIPVYVVVLAGVLLAGVIFIGGLLLIYAGSKHRRQKPPELFYSSSYLSEDYYRHY